MTCCAMTSLDVDRSQAVPSWDGNPRTWRRYTKEVGWFLSGTKSNQRRYAAAKLVSKFTGPVRLLSISWHRFDQMYKWGSVKCNAYSHAGTDLEILQDPKVGRCFVIDQKYYIETLQDVDVTPSRFSDSDSQLTTQEISVCRASLGALQWLAIQTQPLICARYNILLTELSTNPKMTITQEIQEMVKKLRKTSSVLKFTVSTRHGSFGQRSAVRVSSTLAEISLRLLMLRCEWFPVF